ncbi:hypothetical protein JTB14_022008 [Gonioctena quinquepunctata]|nr:hypothetical protein JTB14_022008 [Gonioctena quinquepunctata]
MHETGEYPDTDMSGEDLDDSDADPNYQAESESYDSDTDDSMLRASASISKPQPERNRKLADPHRLNQVQPVSPRDNIVWTDPVGNQKVFQFTGSSRMDPNISGITVLADPIDYFEFFLSSQVLGKMLNETNLYVTQVLEKSEAAPSSVYMTGLLQIVRN